MAKKTFKDNPALQFISEAESQKTPETEQTTAHTPTPAPAPTTEKPPEGYKVNPLFVETKSRRLQLVLQPSLFDRIKENAKENGLSVNEYVHRILDEATRKE